MSKRKSGPEPTVLDWFQSLLRLDPIPIPEAGAEPAPVVQRRKAAPPAAKPFEFNIRLSHLRIPVALILAFLAQLNLERHRSVGLSVFFYLAAGALIGWSLWSGDFEQVRARRTHKKSAIAVFDLRTLLIGLGLAASAALTAADNTFRLPTLLFGVGAVLVTARAFWHGELPSFSLREKLRKSFGKSGFRLSLDRWSLIVVAALGLSAFFRFTQLAEVPFEMWSDHAEKYLDIVDVLNGNTSVFFPNNSGREPIQFYTTAAAIKWFGADFSYLTLKTVTALAGFLTLPYIYLLGREVGGKGVALGALALTGIAYWPNILSRVGMRLPFFPIFLAPALYYLLRGFRQRSQNDFIFVGLFVGLGVYGYTPARIAPLVVALAIGLYLAHRVSRGHRPEALRWIAIAAIMAIVVSAPMIRTAIDFQDEVLYRTVTRISSAERPLPGEPLTIFFSNMWDALRMFTWDFGEIWVLAIPFRPALDWVTGALFHLGVALLAVRYVKGRSWIDLFLLLSIPVLLLPSVLSLAFPGENPHPSRAGGAIIPVFTIAAISLNAIWQWIQARQWGTRVAAIVIGLLFALAAVTNYNLTLVQYGDLERRGAWNTTEAGAAVKGFVDSIGSYENVHMIAYPHWMDSRLVALIAGRPGDDIGLWPELIDELPETDQPQLFLLHPDDQQNLDRLQSKFPNTSLTRHTSEVEGRDFLMLLVPGGGA
jgi:hypothetical protein